MVWIKGPRCGVDNCAARFYEIRSGSRVCQNGHVQAGLETAGDDDDFVAVGQRIARPRHHSAAGGAAYVHTSKDPEVLRGRNATVAAVALLQVVFRHQVRFVIERKKLPRRQFESVARDLWAMFLHQTRLEGLTLLQLVALLYLATRAVDAPVLLGDFVHWIRESRFPYFECWRLLDRQKYLQLPAEQRRHFRPSAEPAPLSLHRTVRTVKAALLSRFPSLSFADIDDRYVSFRLCRDLLLAPQVYVGALRLLNFIGKRRFSRDEKMFGTEEIPAACAVVVATKLYYGLDGLERVLPANRVGNEFSWSLWRDLMRKLWILKPDFGRADERLAQFWTGAEIDAYLHWFRVHLGAAPGLDRRLAAMFPLPSVPDEIEDETVDPQVVKELCAVLHTESPSDSRLESSKPQCNKPHFPPGSCYQAYAVRSEESDELPKLVGILYDLLAQFIAADETSVRRFVRVFEKWAKNQHRGLALTRVNGH